MPRAARPELQLLQMCVKVPPQVFQTIEAETARRDVSRSAWLSQAIAEKLDRDGLTPWAAPEHPDRLFQRYDRSSLVRKKKPSPAKVQVFDHYGRECACCGATEYLSIDHVNGDGKQHRAELGGRRSSQPFYTWLVRNGFPGGYQVLCVPCNSSKHQRSACQIDHVGQRRRVHRLWQLGWDAEEVAEVLNRVPEAVASDIAWIERRTTEVLAAREPLERGVLNGAQSPA